MISLVSYRDSDGIRNWIYYNGDRYGQSLLGYLDDGQIMAIKHIRSHGTVQAIEVVSNDN